MNAIRSLVLACVAALAAGGTISTKALSSGLTAAARARAASRRCRRALRSSSLQSRILAIHPSSQRLRVRTAVAIKTVHD